MFSVLIQNISERFSLVMVFIGKSITFVKDVVNRSPFWFVLSLVIGVSMGITFFAPISEVYKGVASLPSIGGLLTALFQIVRDDTAHKRTAELQNKQQIFNLGATSHMANTVFDKHVEFCEKYLSEVHQTVVTLTREGPTQEALKHSDNLYSLRVDYTAWITPQIEEKLIPFEQAVRNIGAKSGLVDALSKREDRDEKRSKAIEEMFNEFSNLIGLEDTQVKDEQSTVIEVKKRVREILQINQLVSVREYLVNRAAGVTANK